MATFTVDSAHSSVDFTTRHMVFARVRGTFDSFSVDLDIDDATGLPTSVKTDIDANSIDTKNADRDAHLKSPDFLDTAQFPHITFKSTSISGSADSLSIVGNLTIHGVTKPVTLAAQFGGRGVDPWGNERLAYEASAKINRKDFGLTWNQTLETGGVLVGEEIEIAISLEVIRSVEEVAV
jgi:polyisoprenoid-binding protein YceI